MPTRQAKLGLPACKKLIRSTIPGDIQLFQRQTSPKLDDRGSVELSNTVIKGLLEDAEGKDNQSCDKEEEDMTPAVGEDTTSAGSADRIEPKVIEPSESECIDGGRVEALSRGGQIQRRVANQR